MKDLRVRFGLVLALAMLPLLIFSIWQSYYDYKRDSEARYTALILTAKQAATDTLNTLDRAESVLRTIGNTLESDSNCSAILDDVALEFAGVKNLLVANAEGDYICSTDRIAKSAQSFRAAERLSPQAPFAILRRESLSDTGAKFPVLRLAYGTYNGGQLQQIFIADLVQQQMALPVSPSADEPSDILVSILDDQADILAGHQFAGTTIKKEWLNVATRTGEFRGWLRADGRRERDLLILPTRDESLFIALSQPYQSLLSWNFLNPLSSALVPVLAWLFGFFAVWIATDQLILTHLRRMRTGVLRFARGDWDERIGELNNPPGAIKELRRTLDLMADKISTRETELEDALVEKDILLREIHHRVKNNLQIIISLLNMQERKLSDDEGLKVLRETRSRINAIALVHRGLYESHDLRYVPMDVFMTRLVRELGTALGTDQRNITLEAHSDCQPFEADTAIPVALFVVEAITNAMKHGVSDGGNIKVSLHQNEDDIKVSVMDTGQGFELTDMHGGTGGKLMKGFARQLSGDISNWVSEDGHAINLLFTYRPYANDI